MRRLEGLSNPAHASLADAPRWPLSDTPHRSLTHRAARQRTSRRSPTHRVARRRTHRVAWLAAAARAGVPSLIGAALQSINGLVFVGEGVMVAAGAFGRLAAGQVAATALFLLALRLAPASLTGVWWSFWVFNAVRLANFVRFFWFASSPLMPDADAAS